jgi:hypothetical protein
MPKKARTISTQEASLRLSLGICCSWDQLGEKARLRLRNAYSEIIAKSILTLQEYDAGLWEICQAMNKLASINPFCGDELSEDLKTEAMEKASSLLISQGLPFPLPVSGASLSRLKTEWPEIRSRRRRVIRVHKCKLYSLPLNSSWERVRRQEELARAKESRKESVERDKTMQFHGSAFTRFGFRDGYVDKDRALLASLIEGGSTISEPKGYVYLKQWRLPDGNTWHKIGVTINPNRREVEQNVLPVAAETIACVEFKTIAHARSVEKIIHQKLAHLRISGASNRELFRLSPSQLSAVMSALEHLAQ